MLPRIRYSVAYNFCISSHDLGSVELGTRHHRRGFQDTQFLVIALSLISLHSLNLDTETLTLLVFLCRIVVVAKLKQIVA